MKELVVPPAAQADPKSVEILRAWIAGGEQWLSLNPHVYRDRKFDEEWAWGLFLADTIRHIANAIHELTGKDRIETVRLIRQAFDLELEKPTTRIQGGALSSESADDR
jgi:hypothetical protein